jgi:hypothetical protein
VLDNPVQTATEHLFCEDELLEWMSRSSLCPITKTELDPSTIRKPGRIVLNMLAELEMYCKNRVHGCTWTGPQEHLSKHLETCACQSKEDIRRELTEKDDRIKELEREIDVLSLKNEDLLHENACLTEKIEEYQRRIRVFHALLPHNAVSCGPVGGVNIADENDARSFAESLSMLLMDDDDGLEWDKDNNEQNRTTSYYDIEDSKTHDVKYSPVDKRKESSDAERLQRLRSLNSLMDRSADRGFHK